ncbi:hypothetical protein [Curtobacterium sp. MCBD17_040]|uniref:DUF7064 domain-containing protein n=1 Tax=Curtobacterium sp. MCBD17_040 TaxID=2175674 RepID=UPI000DAA092C|nr:hypothetical protein [Curtobacterium sp. MCBD17_040]WIB64721.1 hypothetical protein DEI94_05895 [Curtobacterium sp. MCBD17_040]
MSAAASDGADVLRASRALLPTDDLRHRPAPGARMRDSVFYQTVLPEERLAVQVYLFVTGTGAAGYNVAVWGDAAPTVREFGGGRVAEAMDLDDFTVGGLTVRHRDPLRTADVVVRTDRVELDLTFTALHEAFSFRDAPDGLPSWFAEDRIEQTGAVRGHVRADDHAFELGPIGHRDHSWGLRDWRAPQHWKWLVAYTPSGRAVNGWTWIAAGRWGFAGYVLRDGRPVPVSRIEDDTTYGAGYEQRRLHAVLHDVEGGTTTLDLDVFAVLHLPDERTGTTVLEGGCVARIDGERGAGQFEVEWPTDYFAHLRGDDA